MTRPWPRMLLLTLVGLLSSQDLPELCGRRALGVDPLLDGLNLARSAAQILLCLDEQCQLRSLEYERDTHNNRENVTNGNTYTVHVNTVHTVQYQSCQP